MARPSIRVVLAGAGLFALLAASCADDLGDISVDVDDRDEIDGSGDLLTEDRSVEGFDYIVLAGQGDVRLTQGTRESLTIRTDDNLLDLIETTVEDGRLIIRTADGVDIDPSDSVRYEIGVVDLVGVELSGAGTLVADAWSAQSAEILLPGAGDLRIAGFDADTLAVDLSGAGEITVEGSASVQNVTLSGAGDYHAADLASATASVVASGAGSAAVWATELLDAVVSGAGTIAYYGDPLVTEHVTGVGAVSSLGDK